MFYGAHIEGAAVVYTIFGDYDGLSDEEKLSVELEVTNLVSDRINYTNTISGGTPIHAVGMPEATYHFGSNGESTGL